MGQRRQARLVTDPWRSPQVFRGSGTSAARSDAGWHASSMTGGRSCAPPEVPLEGLPPGAADTCLTEPAAAEALLANRVPRQRVAAHVPSAPPRKGASPV